jgi:hypothetical protein
MAMETNSVSVAPHQRVAVELFDWPWGLLTAAAAFLCAIAVQWMAGSFALSPLRRATPGHWTEKARLAFPGWITLGAGEAFQATLWFLFATVFRGACGFGVVALVFLLLAVVFCEILWMTFVSAAQGWLQGWFSAGS